MKSNPPLIITEETITKSTMQGHRTCTALHAPNARIIEARAFEYNKQLQSASLPKALSISRSAFSNISGLKSLQHINIPQVKSIQPFAFCESGLTSVDAPSAEIIARSAFASCKNLQFATLPKAKIIDTTAFYDCQELTSIAIPQVESIGRDGFANSNITTVNAPKVEEIGYAAFLSCNALDTFIAPEATHILDRAFSSCQQLKQVYIPNAQNIGSNTFDNSPNLEKMIIHRDIIEAHDPIADRTWWLTKGIDPKKTEIHSLDTWAHHQSITLNDTASLLILYRLNQDPDYRPTWPELGRSCPNLPFHLLLKVLPEDKYAQTLPLLSEATLAIAKPQGGKAKNELLASYFHDINMRTNADLDSSEKISHTEAHQANDHHTLDASKVSNPLHMTKSSDKIKTTHQAESHQKEAAAHTPPIEISEAIESIAETLTIKDMAKLMLAKANEPRLSKDTSLFIQGPDRIKHDTDTQMDADKPSGRGPSAAA